MELSATQLLLFLLPFTSCKQSLQRFKDSKNQVRTTLSLSLSLSLFLLFFFFKSHFLPRFFKCCCHWVHEEEGTGMACGHPCSTCHCQPFVPLRWPTIDTVFETCVSTASWFLCWASGTTAQYTLWPNEQQWSCWSVEVLPSGKVCNNFFSFVSFAVILTDSLTDLCPDTHSSLHLLNTWRPLGSSSSQGPRSKWVQGMQFGSLETQFATEVSQASSSSRSGGSSRNQQKRRLLFWFSWDSTVLPAKLKPDIDFQLNPWTLYSLVHPNFDVDLVSVSFSFDEIVFSHSFLFYRKVQCFECNGWTIIHIVTLGER